MSTTLLSSKVRVLRKIQDYQNSRAQLYQHGEVCHRVLYDCVLLNISILVCSRWKMIVERFAGMDIKKLPKYTHT